MFNIYFVKVSIFGSHFGQSLKPYWIERSQKESKLSVGWTLYNLGVKHGPTLSLCELIAVLFVSNVLKHL